MGIVALFVFAVIGWLTFVAVWPPTWAPDAWRRRTRPLRHRVRRRYYHHLR